MSDEALESARRLAPRIDVTRLIDRARRPSRLWFGRARILRAEWIYYPYWVGEARCRRGSDEVALRLAVDGIDGEVRRIDRGVSLTSRGDEPTQSGELLWPSIDALDAEELAAERLPFLLLARRGRSVDLGPLARLELLGWPHLVQHFAIGPRPTFRAYDAVTGERVGPRRRSAILAAWIRRSSEPDAPPSG